MSREELMSAEIDRMSREVAIPKEFRVPGGEGSGFLRFVLTIALVGATALFVYFGAN